MESGRVRPDDRRFFLGLPFFFLGFCFPAGRHFLGKLSFAIIFKTIKNMKRREKIKKNCFQATDRPFQFRKIIFTKNIYLFYLHEYNYIVKLNYCNIIEIFISYCLQNILLISMNQYKIEIFCIPLNIL